MPIEITLYGNPYYIDLPQSLVSWIFWIGMLGLAGVMLLRWRKYNRKLSRLKWGFLVILLALVPLTSLFLVLRLPAGAALPPPGQPVEPVGPAVILFAALPWVLAGGMLGPLPAAGLGLLSGILVSLFDTHSLFTILEYTLLAAALSAAAQQRYRTLFYRLLRQPLVATLLAALVYPVLFIVDTVLAYPGDLAIRLDYTLARAGATSLAMAIQLLIAGLFAQVVAIFLPRYWGQDGEVRPSPAELKLSRRFLTGLTPAIVILIVGLMAGDWIVAGRAAENMLRSRLESMARMSATSVPFFLETGQSLIQQLASQPDWFSADSPAQTAKLQNALHSVPFFRELYLLDASGNAVNGYPQVDIYASGLTPEEYAGIQPALNGMLFQYYTIPPAAGETIARVSFITAIQDQSGQINGVLIGRSDLASNPLTQPVLATLAELGNLDGEGILLDDEGRVLYRTDGAGIMEGYTGRTASQAEFFKETAADGTRSLVYYQPVTGRPWAVVTSVPARQAQQLALQIAAPLLTMMALFFGLILLVVSLVLRKVTGSLQHLTMEANRLSSGQLETPLVMDGVDEVGQLRRSFEHMRTSLKARLDELNRLLRVSQGVASSLEMEEAVKPVLDSALGIGACSVRVVLSPEAVPDADSGSAPVTNFGLGPCSELYKGMDEQILASARHQERMVLTNLSRARMFSAQPGTPRPESLLALPLRHESLYYGVLWLGYDTPHQFSDDEIRFLTTLAGQAALASANARLFANAEVGRQRLAAILTSTPDPVLVTDHRNRLLLANPAAWHALGLVSGTGEGQPIEQITQQPELVHLLRTYGEDGQSAEVALPDERVYLAIASSIIAEGKPMGRVCILRDVTHFKELDSLKSEFVATVSHDLRSPLTLIRGYATMLEMVGDLNEQQTSYARKIINGVEGMTRLVTNLLDLGRIEAGVDLQLEMVPVQDIVERVVNAMQLQASQKQLQIAAEIAPNTIPLVEADQALLQQALQNLVENAVKYTEAGGRITVRVSPDQDRLIFEVNDTGIGIAPVDQPRLFEKFYRGGQKEAKKRQGTGLGLAIVKSIVDRHKGQTWVESQLGKGSSFFFAIPFRQPKEDK